MSGTGKTVVAVAGGYLLGRTKKMKLAIMMAGLLAGKKLPTSGREVQHQLQDLLQNNPEVSKLVQQVQGNLAQAARAAAVTAASQGVNRLSDSLHERAEAMRPQDGQPQGQEGETSESEDGTDTSGAQESSADEQSEDTGSGDDQSDTRDDATEQERGDQQDESGGDQQDESGSGDEDPSKADDNREGGGR